MDRFFEVITKIDRFLRQRYEQFDTQSRTFWNQIMVFAGLIKLYQAGLVLNLGNLVRETPISQSSIYRTLAVLEGYDIIKKDDDNPTNYVMIDIPKDILELETSSKQAIDTNTLKNIFRPMLASIMEDAMSGLQIEESKIKEVKRRVQVKEEEALSEIDDMFGQGSFM